MLSEKDKALVSFVHTDVQKNKLEILIMGHKEYIQMTIDDLKKETLAQSKYISEQQIEKLVNIYTTCIERVLGSEAII
jgi:hypothetical protein